MRVKNLINWIYRVYGQSYFVSNQVLRKSYTPYSVTNAAIYTAVHRAWKMGLLSRQKNYGNSYSYRLTDWAVRYIKDGWRYSEDEVRFKLLDYIIKYGDEKDLDWAEQVLAKKLLQRYFPGRSAQDIKPITDLLDAVENSISLLESRIRNECIALTEDFELDNDKDFIILVLVDELLKKNHLFYKGFFDSEKIKVNQMERRLVLDEAIDDIRYPKRDYIILDGSKLGSDKRFKMRLVDNGGLSNKTKERMRKTIHKLRNLQQDTENTLDKLK